MIGNAGSRRVTLYVAADQGTFDQNTTFPGTVNMTVGTDSVLRVKILDGASHVNMAANFINTSIILDRDGWKSTAIDLNTGTGTTGNYRLFGEKTADGGHTVYQNEVIDIVNYPIPHWENSLCANGYGYTGTEYYISLASKLDKFTFSGDAQIAHVVAANPITLSDCGTDFNNILIGGGGSCTFDYKSVGTGGAVNNYCPTHAAGKLCLESEPTFGDLDDRFDIEISVLTDGVYFSGYPALFGLLPAQDACNDAGTAIALTNTDFAVGGVWQSMNGTFSFPTTDACTVDAQKRVNVIRTFGGDITGIENYHQIAIDFAKFQYDTAVIGAATEVELRVILYKYPCGAIFASNITIGTFLTACPSEGTVTGRVWIDFAGHPDLSVTNATISLEGTAYTTASDTNGNFFLTGISPGTYNMVVAAENMVPFRQAVTVEDLQILNVVLPSMVVLNPANWDMGADGRIGLAEAIHALQVVSGFGPE